MVKEGNLEPPTGHPKSCANCLFKIGGPVCPASRNKAEDYDEPCSSWRYRGQYSVEEMKRLPNEPRSTEELRREKEEYRRKYRPKEW